MGNVLRNRMRLVITVMLCVIITILARGWENQEAAFFASNHAADPVFNLSEKQSDEAEKLVLSAQLSAEKYKKLATKEYVAALILAVVTVVVSIVFKVRINKWDEKIKHGAKRSQAAENFHPMKVSDIVVIVFMYTMLQIGTVVYRQDEDFLKSLRFVAIGFIVVAIFFIAQEKVLGIKKLKVGQVEKSSRGRQKKRKDKPSLLIRFVQWVKIWLGTTGFGTADNTEERDSTGDSGYKDPTQRELEEWAEQERLADMEGNPDVDPNDIKVEDEDEDVSEETDTEDSDSDTGTGSDSDTDVTKAVLEMLAKEYDE